MGTPIPTAECRLLHVTEISKKVTAGLLTGPSASVVPAEPENSKIASFHLNYRYMERKCADTIGTVPVPWAGHSINAKIFMYFSNKIYGTDFIKQHSETVMV